MINFYNSYDYAPDVVCEVMDNYRGGEIRILELCADDEFVLYAESDGYVIAPNSKEVHNVIAMSYDPEWLIHIYKDYLSNSGKVLMMKIKAVRQFATIEAACESILEAC